MKPTFPTADVFCRVIDNFGDAGVAWRLAARLMSLGVKIRFITDHPETLALIAPDAHDRARVVAWNDFSREASSPSFVPGELIIETFGCRLPESYDAAAANLRAERLARGERAPFYFNLDYLSAEPWVEDCHEVVGLHPKFDLPKLWYFPGFTDRTGGVLIEDDYSSARDEFLTLKAEFLKSLGADPQRDTFFYFTYPVNDVEAFAKAARIASASRPINVLVAPGEAGERLSALLADCCPANLLALKTPFLPQKDFDKLLWSADAAVVRGEDSFVRAQLAGLPFLWSTYPTADNGHRVKLDAWLDRIKPGFDAFGLADEYIELARNWLDGTIEPQALAEFLLASRSYRPAFGAWSRKLFERGDLAKKMLDRARAD